MSYNLAPMLAAVMHDLPVLIERTLKQEIACQNLAAQCNALILQIDGAKERIAEEKTMQRLLRAQIATFLRQRGQLRDTTHSSPVRVRAQRSMVVSTPEASVVADTNDNSMNSGDGTNSLYQESPLCLKAKRKGRIFDCDIEILPKRRRLTVDDVEPTQSEL
ncbi:hypothetical protein C8Q77DRAFT_837955 [Trametes polyzona]|nr:hypothetical protein C8Q77DRAFT_837955 [Trametes polyzona]